jgi:hypothetical protein
VDETENHEEEKEVEKRGKRIKKPKFNGGNDVKIAHGMKKNNVLPRAYDGCKPACFKELFKDRGGNGSTVLPFDVCYPTL